MVHTISGDSLLSPVANGLNQADAPLRARQVVEVPMVAARYREHRTLRSSRTTGELPPRPADLPESTVAPRGRREHGDALRQLPSMLDFRGQVSRLIDSVTERRGSSPEPSEPSL